MQPKPTRVLNKNLLNDIVSVTTLAFANLDKPDVTNTTIHLIYEPDPIHELCSTTRMWLITIIETCSRLQQV
jgi:hypothetical protein